MTPLAYHRCLKTAPGTSSPSSSFPVDRICVALLSDITVKLFTHYWHFLQHAEVIASKVLLHDVCDVVLATFTKVRQAMRPSFDETDSKSRLVHAPRIIKGELCIRIWHSFVVHCISMI